MSSDKKKVAMVGLGVFAHCCLVFVPIIGEFRPTIGSLFFAFATLVIASHYEICFCAPCWGIEHPHVKLLVEFLMRLGILNFAITTIWLPIVAFLSTHTSISNILCGLLCCLRLDADAAKVANDPEMPRRLAALLALGAAACACYVTDFCCTVSNVFAGCPRERERRVCIMENPQQNELRSVLRTTRSRQRY